MDGGVVDRSIGTLVWVRRRNGSWWPGRIVASEELPAAHLLSARSGTPVKLLGREDASVDWYNLDKSKRVKAFRCGEFDACIKTAEASLNVPTRKREKYARKEDAIIQALKLERQQFGHPHQFEDEPKNLNKINSCMVDDQPIILRKLTNNKSTILSRNSVLSSDEENNSNSHHNSHREKCSSTVALKEKNDKPFPQMNGLQNFDLSVAPPKKKFKFTDWEAACKPSDNHENVLSTAEPEIHDKNRKKRSQSGLNENSFIEKTDRQQQAPSQVLLSSAHLPAFSSHKSDLQRERHNMKTVEQSGRRIRVYIPGKSSDSEEDSDDSCKETRGRNTHYKNSSELSDETESDSSKAESFQHGIGVNRRMTETSQPLGSRPDHRKTSTNQASENVKYPDNNNDASTPSPSLSSYLQNHTTSSTWNSKGKRNTRQRKKRSFSSRQTYGNWRYPFPLQGDKDHTFIYQDEMGFRLVDVNIQVHQQNHRGEHVPWVSLSSKGNHGKPIVGHPVLVEILEDGSTLQFDGGYTKAGKRSAAVQRTPRSDQRKLPKVKNNSLGKSAQKAEPCRKVGGLPVIACVPVKVVFSRILESVRVTS